MSDFSFAKKRPQPEEAIHRQTAPFPWFSVALLLVMTAGCLCASLFVKDPGAASLSAANLPPGRGHWFGTDALGRDVFAMLWCGGGTSLIIGFGAAALSALTAFVWGTLSAFLPGRAGRLMMRAVDILMSVPGILLVIFLSAVFGARTPLRLALVIGMTGWMSLSKVVRAQAAALRESPAVLSARSMGAGFWHLLTAYIVPELAGRLMFMLIMAVRAAIAEEATLSFIGLGLPVGTLSLGSLLALADKAILSGSWWLVVLPGVFLVTLLLCLSTIGEWARRREQK